MDRDTLIRQYLPVVKKVASRIAHRLPPHVDFDDLIGSGTLGLIDAVDKFDRSSAVDCKKYVEIRVNGAILDHLRAMDHTSRTARQQAAVLDKAARAIAGEKGRQATHEEMATHLGLSLEQYYDIVDNFRPIRVVSVYDLLGADSPDRDPFQFLEDRTSVNPHDELSSKRLREIVRDQIEGLNERHRVAMTLHYYDQMTLKNIGKVLGVSESRVSQVLREATDILRKRLTTEFISDV